MKDTSVVFDEAASRADKRPRFVLYFQDLGFRFSSYKKASEPEWWDIITEVSGTSGQVRPNEGVADISGVTVKVMDDTRFHQFAPLVRREERVKLYGGFASIPDDDAQVLITGLVEDIYEDVAGGEWTIRINDLNFYKIASAFRSFGKSTLDGDHAAGDVTITVLSTDGTADGDSAFHDPGDSPTNGYLLIDDEIIPYTALGGGGVTFTGCTRGQHTEAGGSEAASHSDGAQVHELFRLYGNPVDLYLSMLTSTGTGLNGAYDLWESDQGLGIDDSVIDIDKFEEERDRFLPSDNFQFFLKEEISQVKSWSEKQIFRVINAYPIVTGAGKISFRLYNPPFDSDPDELNYHDVESISQQRRGLKEIINNTVVHYDKNIVSGSFQTKRYDLQSDSINDHGLSRSWKCESDGLYSLYQADSIIDRNITRMFNRYKNGVASFVAKIFFSKFKWDPGEIIKVTLSYLVDWAKGTRGVDERLMEVVTIRPNMLKGEIDCEIWDTGLSGKYGIICPNSYPTYADATNYQKQWGYVCETATEEMPDGDPPTLIM